MRLSTARREPGTRRTSPRWRRVLAVLAAVLLVFGVVTARLFAWPAIGMPARVSAIVLLAGPGDRLPVALGLARQHRAPELVVSQGQHGYGGPCPPATPGVRLICFDPVPGNTRGEAEFVGRLARKYHWTSMVVVSSRSQDTRARIVVGRCFGGRVYVVTGPLPLRQWPYEIAYGWGALVKALVVERSC